MQIRRVSMMVIRYVWAAPCSLFGLFLAGIAMFSGASMHRCGGTLEVAGGMLGLWLSQYSRTMRFYAITLGHVILGVNQAVLSSHRKHERIHVRQYERWGILFIPLYCVSSLVQLFQGRDPYLDNWFEREACPRNPLKK